MSTSAYPDYKDSEIEWLGQIPSHWAVKRLRFVAEINPSKFEVSHLAADTEVSFLPMEAIGEDGSLDLDRVRPLADVQTGYTFFRDGDVTIAKITPCFENGKGAAMRDLFNGIGFGTTELIVTRPKATQTTSTYLQWLFTSRPFRMAGEAFMYGAGGQKRVPDDFVRDFAIGFPPLLEQRHVVAFLDRETAKIDTLVDDQKHLIKLLKEKRQAVISQAITKGLDPDVPMKDSGVEWLGEVPAHWGHARKLVDLAANERHSFVNGPFGSDLLTGELTDEGVPVVYIRDIKPKGYQRVSEWHVTADKARQLAFCNVISGDIVIAKVGDPPGLAAIYPDEEPDGIVTQDVIRLRLNRSKAAPSYIRWLLNSQYGQTMIDDISVESTRTRVGLGEYKQLRFFVPPLQEQEELARHIDGFVAGIDRLVSEASLAATLLQERRSALISAAVTGKIDVRGQVAQSEALAA